MKKRVCFILALVFMACICLCGCSADEQEKTELPQIKYENFYNYEEFFILNQDSGRITQTAVSYRQGNVYEVCDGKLFRVYSLEPWTAEFSTGEKIPLIDKE